MESDHSGRAPYAPSRAFLVPVASIVLSLPTLFVGLFLVVAGVYRAISGSSLYTGATEVVQVPVLACLFLILGPMLALVLCTTQRTRAEQVYGSALLLGFRIKRLNTIALWCAGLALAMLPLMAAVSVVVNSLYPQ